MKKNNKKGFFLSETMVVMAIVTVVILSVFKIFSTTYVKYKESENYNTVNAVNALANVKKYFESFGVIDSENLLNNNAYIDLTNYVTYNSEFYESIKEQYNIDRVYLINMSTINSNLTNLDMTFRKYIKTLKQNNEKLLVVNVEGNKYASASLASGLPMLVGKPDDEYGIYLIKGEEFIDPGYLNWNKETPTTSWEDGKALDINTVGNYYLIYDFNNYLIRRKISVINYSTSGLMLHYDGNLNNGNAHSNTSTTWTDLSGNNRTGTLNNNPTWGSNYLEFDGTDDWVAIAKMLYPNQTLELVYSIGGTTSSTPHIFGNWNSGGMGILSSTTGTSIQGYTYFTTLANYSILSSSILLNTKYSTTISYDGSTYKMYVNGKLSTSTAIVDTIKEPSSDTIMVIGGNPGGSNVSGGFFKGRIYSARIYNRALTDREIEINYQIDKNRFDL